ncbi:hypothetical protein RMCBS344292_09665 [Rhizopus microsporus]|nr:hypothetical protein RMCBS344292_09665 [Rhizopus microsporus]
MQKLLFSSEFLASGHSNEFREFITRIIQSKSKAEEKGHVQEELTQLASKLSSPDTASVIDMSEKQTIIDMYSIV